MLYKLYKLYAMAATMETTATIRNQSVAPVFTK